MAEPFIRRFLDLSTSHMTPETREGWTMGIGRPGWATPTEFGFFVWAGTEEDEEPDADLPEDVATCRRFARCLGCDYLLFDADADTIDALPTFDD